MRGWMDECFFYISHHTWANGTNKILMESFSITSHNQTNKQIKEFEENKVPFTFLVIKKKKKRKELSKVEEYKLNLLLLLLFLFLFCLWWNVFDVKKNTKRMRMRITRNKSEWNKKKRDIHRVNTETFFFCKQSPYVVVKKNW